MALGGAFGWIMDVFSPVGGKIFIAGTKQTAPSSVRSEIRR